MPAPAAEAQACPSCSGVLLLQASEASRDGQLILAGCLTRGDGSDPQWQCQAHASHRRTNGDPDSPMWLHALTQAMAGRPHCQYYGGPSTLLVYQDAAEIFAPDLADGRATLTDEPAPAGVNAQHRCPDCGHTWR